MRRASGLFDIGGSPVPTGREKTPVARPQPSSADQHDGAGQIYIHRTQSTSPQVAPVNQRHHLLMGDDREPLEALEESQHLVAWPDRPERQFLDHSSMTSDLIVMEQRDE